jgi:hypothetical protein
MLKGEEESSIQIWDSATEVRRKVGKGYQALRLSKTVEEA